MIIYCSFIANLEPLNITHLLYCPMILLNLPMPVMLFGKCFLVKNSGFFFIR